MHISINIWECNPAEFHSEPLQTVSRTGPARPSHGAGRCSPAEQNLVFLYVFFKGRLALRTPPQQDRTTSFLPGSGTLGHFTPARFSSGSVPSRKRRTDAAAGLSSPRQRHEVFSARESARLRQVSVAAYDCCSMTRYDKAREHRTF